MIASAVAVAIAGLVWLAWEGGGMLAALVGYDELWPLIQPGCVVVMLSLVDWAMRRV